MTRTALITGARGFIGRHMAAHWAEQGYEVVGVGNGTWNAADAKRWGVSRWVPAEVSLVSLRSLQIEPEVIFHGAGGSSVGCSMAQPLEDFQRTVQSVAYVLEYVRLSCPEARMVYPSSASVYGQAAAFPTREDAARQPVSVYGVHKQAAEDLCNSYHRYFGLRVAIVRLFSVYGAGLRKQLLWDACQKATRGDASFWGTGAETRDWIHVKDAVRLIDVLSQAELRSCVVVNGASGEGVAIRSILENLLQRFNTRLSPAFTGAARQGDPTQYWAAIQAAQNLGWQPERNLDSGIDEYVQWFKSLKN